MFRRFYAYSGNVIGGRFLTINNETRDSLTKHLGALKEESKGQGLDLADMADASRTALRSLQETINRSAMDDAQFKGKYTTLSASIKSYTVRLSNLQNEARSIQTEVDALLKLIWGTEAPKPASFSTPPKSVVDSTVKESNNEADEFVVEPPPIARVLEEERKPEVVEGERVADGAARGDSKESVKSEEIEVETIEVEVEPQQSPVDAMKITDITKDLYERGVNFSDCLDARSLRQRYKDVLDGKIQSGVQSGTLQTPEPNRQQPRMPQKPQQQPYQQQTPNSTESGLAHDPYPNAYRKMVDPMKHVWELKNELASEKGIDPNSVDLWSGKVKLEDSKRLYDYPSVQSYPIEVRQKGDIPR